MQRNRKTIMQRDRASFLPPVRVFRSHAFCSGGPPNATQKGVTALRKPWGHVRPHYMEPPPLCLSRESDTPFSLPLLPLSPISLPSAPSSSVLVEAPCTPVLSTRVQSVPAAVLHRLFYGASILCRVHKTSGAREAIDCVIEGGMEHSRRLSSYLSMTPRNRPVSASQRLLAETCAVWIERPESCETTRAQWNQRCICSFYSRRISGQFCVVLK
jgi:hypothetical protein